MTTTLGRKKVEADWFRPDRPIYTEAELRRRDALDLAIGQHNYDAGADLILATAARFQAFICEGCVREPVSEL